MKKSEKKSDKKLKIENPKTNIKEFFDIVVKNNLEDFNKYKKLEPHVILLTDKRKMLVAPLMDCKSSEERFSVLSELGKKLIEKNIDIEVTISVSESWMSVGKKSEYITRPSNDPQRKEILMFSAIDKTENQITSMYKIERKEDNVILNSMKNEIELLDKWIKKDDIKENYDFNNFLLGSFWHAYKDKLCT